MLFNEPKLLKSSTSDPALVTVGVSVLFNEPKLLKSELAAEIAARLRGFSALQRAEIAEMRRFKCVGDSERLGFSALQRAEIAEILRLWFAALLNERGFSALQRAEIAEIDFDALINARNDGFSALQRAEIAEMPLPF